MKKVLITGTTGMLGFDLVRLFNSNPKYEVYGLGRSLNPLLPRDRQIVMDLSQPALSKEWNIKPDVIIHTAALTDLALCERDPLLANRVHVEGSQAVAKIAGKQTRFFNISTDSVFDGIRGGYTEQDSPNPLNEYARSKLRGEAVVRETAAGEVIILRTNIYGFHVPMKSSLAEWAFREWSAERTISGFTDTIFNAVYINQLSVIIEWMIDNDILFPILNIGSSEAISKFDFLEKFRKKINTSSTLLEPSLSSTSSSLINRPLNTSLDTSLLSSFYRVPDFDSGLKLWIHQAKEYNPLNGIIDKT